MSFEYSFKTNADSNSLTKIHLLQAKNKQLEYSLKLLEIKINQLEQVCMLMAKQILQKDEEIQVLIEKSVKLKKRTKMKEMKFKKVLEYINEQIKQQLSANESIIQSMRQQNIILRTKIEQKIINSRQNETSSLHNQIISDQIFNLGQNLLNNCIWKLEEIYIKYLREDNQLKPVIFSFFKNFLQATTQENILSAATGFFMNLSEYQKSRQKNEVIQQIIQNFIQDSEHLLLSSSEEQN